MRMKTLIAKAAVAALGLTLAFAPLAASAAPWGDSVRVGGPCYGCYHHHWAPAPHYYGHPYGWRPAGFVYYNGYYGVAPGGFYGYYWNGGWYHHRRWSNGIWIYF